jgi:protein-S-isoprenylcysteine O-methyltransferase Ste14
MNLRNLRASVIGLVVLGILIFVPAGTLAYWQGWLFIVVFALSTNVIGVYLARNDPALLERRMRVGPHAETRPVQKVLIALAFVAFFALPAFSALDHRLGWSDVPGWVSVFGAFLVALGLMVDLLVFRENSFGASTIEKMEGQRTISTGPYALVRHPMYVGALIMVLGVPLALGSYWGLLFMLFNVPLLALRILDEEEMLLRELNGYAEYAQRVRYRLVPGVW